ncbi:Uncharacterised protein [Proteus mirabilis]|uniref:Uncharacterized protein n=1 Tax=Proteus mirabilis TaxID=584 RepID=A0A2X2DND9_PROMI|nr:hypothetical protein HMPREF1310_00621 [Proteus mirabilis WGLW4]KGA89130.1 hypothetical protein DR94_3312 [Proteus mirabilis]QXL78913.1 hypothetical protein KPK64_03174 [Proteus mirabilis]CAJ0562725.1 hypothetical protein DJICPGNB_16320 [Proteus mirabilis]SDC81642.1 hypothetical protein SAMN05216484_108103 [Proteus mirabilis]
MSLNILMLYIINNAMTESPHNEKGAEAPFRYNNI